ncbi:DUF1349 domain-containing protein [Cytophaga aurantiaca]|uniref:DUF1349 domain-containing protein n=1 Tax=Cytophaga aurantiaca TaxID=29530 RepID=UPI0003A84924|nr:T9SS type A sorting domain-containing protein [Cytophaga aurantiaca]
MKKLILLVSMTIGSFFQIANAQTTVINGLTVITDFSDYSFGVSKDTISLLMNQPGYNLWNTNGSVKDFFYTQTNGKITINSTVVKVKLPGTFAYYLDGGAGGDSIVPHIIKQINLQFPNGFQNLTVHPTQGGLWHLNILTRGYKGGGFSFGFEGAFIKNNGQSLEIKRGSISIRDAYSNQTINTTCHEMGHSLFGWTDYYRTNVSNLGNFCVMASAGSETPMPINPGLRYIQGWTNQVDVITGTTTQTYSVTANSYNQVYKYSNVNNPKEYILIVAHIYNGYYQSAVAPDQGLAIYYVDEEGGTVTSNGEAPIIHLIQADGLDQMHDEGSGKLHVRGDANDLFDNSSTNVFSAASHPFRWKNGNETGLTITNISAVGATMSFTVQGRPNTISSQLNAVNGGTIIPSGALSYINNQNKYFSIVADIGYQVDKVYIDGASIGAQSSYTFTGVSGSHSITATFKKAPTADLLPSPWVNTEIGATRNAGTAGYRNGVFGLESGSYDIYYNSDGLNFIYQSLQGDGQIVAHIKDMNKPTDWSKAGIMMRETTAAGSKNFAILKTPFNSVVNQLRPATDGGSISDPQNIKDRHIYTLDNWLKITRQGNTFTSYCSRDSVTWVQMGTYTIDMNSTISVGLCAGAASDAVNTKVTFDYAKVTKYNPNQNLFTQFGIPRSTPIPTLIKNFKYVYSVGTGGPNLSNVSLSVINWDLVNNGLWQFSLQTNNGSPRWYTNIPAYGFNSFGQASPKIYIDGSMGFPGFEGFFFANIYNTNELVLVNQSGAYAVIFTNTPPTARIGADESEATAAITDVTSVSTAPNPFADYTTVSIPDAFGTASITVINSIGAVIETKVASGSFTLGTQYAAGVYLVKIASAYKTETIQVIKAQ